MINENYPGIRHDLISWREIYKKIGGKEMYKVLETLYTINELEERYEKEFSMALKNLRKFQSLTQKSYNFEMDLYRCRIHIRPKNLEKLKNLLINNIVVIAKSNEYIKQYTKRLKKEDS